MTKTRPPVSLCLRLASEDAAKIGVRPEEVAFGVDRRRAICWARARLCRQLRAIGYSLPGIGGVLGLDHTTVLHALRRPVPDEPPPLNKRVRKKRMKELPRVSWLWKKLPRADAHLPLMRPSNREIHDRRYNARPPYLGSDFRFPREIAMARRA